MRKTRDPFKRQRLPPWRRRRRAEGGRGSGSARAWPSGPNSWRRARSGPAEASPSPAVWRGRGAGRTLSSSPPGLGRGRGRWETTTTAGQSAAPARSLFRPSRPGFRRAEGRSFCGPILGRAFPRSASRCPPSPLSRQSEPRVPRCQAAEAGSPLDWRDDYRRPARESNPFSGENQEFDSGEPCSTLGTEKPVYEASKKKQRL